MKRVLVLVLDSAGVGALPDADLYGDAGASTLPHLAEAVGGLHLPELQRLGLGNIASISGVPPQERPEAYFGKMAEASKGKDTTTGHWEMMGIILERPFATFPEGFPEEIIDPFVKATQRQVLGNQVASGTQIIEALGEEHLKTGKWIVYTSADSVFQVAAHEEKIALEELYLACRHARKLLDDFRVGRVIARPFVGQPGSFERTYHRHDFSMPPDGDTVLVELQKAAIPVFGVGKINDIFAGVGIDHARTTSGNLDGLAQTEQLLLQEERGLIFVNLVDFDMNFGHRRDPVGYARALEEFDRNLPSLKKHMREDDLLLITADHGCDPTFLKHTDHTREYVPILAWSPRWQYGGSLGERASFADLGASVAHCLGVDWKGAGTSFVGYFE